MVRLSFHCVATLVLGHAVVLGCAVQCTGSTGSLPVVSIAVCSFFLLLSYKKPAPTEMKPEAQTNSKLTDSPERRQDSAIAFSTNGLGASSIIEPDTISSVHRHAHHRHRHRHSPHHPPRSTAELVIKIVASVLLVLLAGLFSG